jgi:GH43 family beta-xylosidase
VNEQYVTRREFARGAISLGVSAVAVSAGYNLFLPFADAESAPRHNHRINNENVIQDNGADPSPAYIEGMVRYIGGAGSQLFIRTAENMMELSSNAGPFIPSEMVLDLDTDPYVQANIGPAESEWGPSVSKSMKGGRHVVAYFAYYDGHSQDNQQILVAESKNIDSPFSVRGKLNTGLDTNGDPKWAIDASTFMYNGINYCIYSGKEATGGPVNQNLYLAPLANDHTFAAPPIIISEPMYEWEEANPTQSIQEAPIVFVSADGQSMQVIYSAGPSWETSYCLGMLNLESNDPYNQPLFVNNGSPVFQSAAPYEGTGSCGITTDSVATWLSYNCFIPGEEVIWENRQVRAQQISTGSDGLLDFTAPRGSFLPITS